ncbi:unnamed protein product [marine sediment metagenome]|uniref:Uncharacterized protein n=1 Tax=marine sediment metagenome TaxID=412755 RepID=X0TGG5_9ZZZZ
MDNSKLEYAIEIKRKIDIKNNKLKAIEEIRTKSVKEENNCKVYICNDALYIDQDIFDIALTLQEKRESKICLGLELIYEKL